MCYCGDQAARRTTAAPWRFILGREPLASCEGWPYSISIPRFSNEPRLPLQLPPGAPGRNRDRGRRRQRRPSGSHSLPPDILQEAARRLGALCLISAVVWTANLLLLNFVYAVPGTVPANRVGEYSQWRSLYDAVITANILGSLGLFWFTRDVLSLSWTLPWFTRS